ncbi:S9 family peptidase [Winogradskyella sp. KYW1333]|jgi:pimeloyl-ACP methyl ester carboxylesterase|uniref:alpha/beta hydrolase family protein n=1 Tax=unclassified Winogradskyella TaxID=2615021 RepID=UPI000DF23518|nr:alpha/beta hydrolase [Winogradskyella sp. KYW1333]RCT54853.1 alpha/beta hydrolase [Winogradskyella sp. KYW1333]
MKTQIYTLLILISNLCFSQNEENTFLSSELSITKWIDGTLLIPEQNEANKLAIIIAGSGPTDRNGNQNFLINNSLKKLAEELTNNGIATFRYDKRIVKQIRQGNLDNNIKFDDFINDASDVITHFKTSNQFSEIFVIGHSQGSLVGMIASQDKVNGFVSLAGTGQNIGDVIIEQINNTAPMLKEDTEQVVSILKAGKTTNDYPLALSSMFSKDIQPFMISWMAYNPTNIINSLNCPVLIVNGTKDLQVSVKEAELLKRANDNSNIVIIEKMNHVLIEIEGDDLENSKSYNESFRKISPTLIENITNFIKS